jgi:acyl carrier protein
MTPESVVARAFNRDVAEINDASSPDSLTEWDSLGHFTLLIELEATYGVSFSPEEALSMTSVDRIKAVLSGHDVRW